jgi:hypothetical protein
MRFLGIVSIVGSGSNRTNAVVFCLLTNIPGFHGFGSTWNNTSQFRSAGR